MEFRKGNMFDEAEGPIFVTSCSLIENGVLNMTKGAPQELVDEEGVEVAEKFASLILQKGIDERNQYGKKYKRYGCFYLPKYECGIFQVKYHPQDNIDLELVKYSAMMLAGIARAIEGPININNIGGNTPELRSNVVKILSEILENEDVNIWRLDSASYKNQENYNTIEV